jgi:hypothetical protein
VLEIAIPAAVESPWQVLVSDATTSANCTSWRTGAFLSTVIAHMDDDEAVFKRVLDDEQFRQAVTDFCTDRVYRKARGPR